MGSRAFWIDVLRPVLDALAPSLPSRIATRIRNAAIGAAILVLLLPAYGPLGSATVMSANILAGVYVLVGFVAHFRKSAPRAVGESLVALIGAGLFANLTSGAWWGLALAGVMLLHALASAARRRTVLPLPPHDRDAYGKRYTGWPYRIERLAYGFATVFVFITFAAQATKVPTGSMQPTIMGDHMKGPVGVSGDRLFADQAVYFLRDPKRFEIAVFQYPLRRDILFVKRIVGLPGETVEIKDGDIWVDGAIVTKPPVVQETLWFEVFPRPTATSRPKKLASAWKLSEDAGFRRDGDHGVRLVPRKGAPGLVRYGGKLASGDVRISFTATAEADDAVAMLAVSSGGRDVTLDVPANAAAQMVVNGGEPLTLDTQLGAATRYGLAIVDGHAVAYVAGRPAAMVALPPASRRGRPKVSFGGRGGAMRLADVRLDEDIRYQANGGLSKWVVPEDSYVALGDNTGNSIDSRLWSAVAFHVKGHDEPLWAEISSTDLAGGMVSNVVTKNGRVRFVDIDGVVRDFPRDDLISKDRPANRPFVPRDHFVGRAVLVFWPWYPTWRPRVLP